MKNIYIGFAIDMDGASHNKINATGGIIPKTHPKYEFYTNEMNVFLEGMDKLFNFFDKYNCQKSATWFVNEFSFKTSEIYPKIIDKCIKLGELGLHTHFDTEQLGGQGRYISENKDDWFEEGLQIPTNDLQNILNKSNKKLISFKAGCHLRNNEMFDAIGKLGYIYDTTMVYEDKVLDKDNKIVFDDTELKFGTLPFFIRTKNNYRILEIPEIRPNIKKIKKHVDKTPHNTPIFIRLQVHPYNVIENLSYLNNFDKVIEYCKSVGNVEFKNIEEMGDIFMNYIMKLDSSIIPFKKDIIYSYKKPKISNFFEKLYLIATDNISINEINDNYNDLLSINLFIFNNDIKGSAGIYFSFPISFLAKYNYQLPIQKYKFSFNAKITKIDSNFRFKIYTGFKYVTIDKELTEEYQEFVLEDEFNFNKSSTYRIGFVNPKKDIELFINNPLIE